MNRNTLILLITLLTLLAAAAAFAQDETDPVVGQGNGICQFIDEDGDGFNDLAPDADGDGIPNGMDEDYVKPEDGSGNQYKFGQLDSETKVFGVGSENGMHYGPGDGTGLVDGPADGTGFGPGDCDEDTAKTTPQTPRRGGRS